RAGSDTEGGPSLDPSLIAAQGQDWLRRGEPGRAGDLLAAAAAAERNPDRALSRASEAAAALISAERYLDAVGVLVDIAVANPSGEHAGATHLQAIVMASKYGDQQADVASQIEALLRNNLKAWPAAPNAKAARAWLQKLLRSQNRFVEAAQVASTIPTESTDVGDVQSLSDAWIDAIERVPESAETERRELRRLFQASLLPLRSSELILDQYRLITAIFLDRETLANLPRSGVDNTAMDQFVNALIEYREKGGLLSQQPPAEWATRVERRLMADGRKYPNLRTAAANTIASWGNASGPSVAKAERLLWNRDVEQAIAMLRTLRAESNKKGVISRQSATLLGSSGDAVARREAIRIWDELASGSKQGSSQWHEAKLAAIRLLRDAGEREEAYRRAKFIRLTHPQMSETLRRDYGQFSKP
ncbi:MAG: hypothetical protein ACR2NZ_00285, partial [Rubripirellula sp.]